jgi:hypothetical protein
MTLHACAARHWLSAVLLLASVADLLHAGQDSPFFPREGAPAVHQRSLDVENHAVVMVVAPQPGYEDLRLMAYLRAFKGVRTAVAFLTNGEVTAGDTLAQHPVLMTGERKMETHRVARLLDADAWFVNAPDIAAPDSWSGLARLWDSTGATKRLVEAVRTVQPDLIVVTADRRAASGRISVRDSVVLAIVRNAIAAAAGTRDTSMSRGLLPWTVARLYVQRPAARTPGVYALRHPVLRTTASAMADTAGTLYRTLRLRVREWASSGCSYHDVTGGGFSLAAVSPDKLIADLQDPGVHLETIAKGVRAAIRTNARAIRSVALKDLLPLTGATENAIIQQKKLLTRRERRIVIAWKEALEDLRCAVRGISIPFSATDSVLTASQIFFLSVAPDKVSKGRGETIIIFPLAVLGEWTVNEKAGYFFPLDTASRFNILTPSEVQYTVPVSEFGLSQSRMEAVFPFVVIHKDPSRELSYMFRREVRLQFGPRRTFTLRTPLVYDAPSSPVVVELQNISRDKFRGDLVLSDTTGKPDRLPVEFTRKDEKIVDTLYLPGEPALKTGGRLLLLELSGRGGKRSVTARAFSVAADSATRAGLLSSVSDSPLEEALRIAGQPRAKVTVSSVEAGTHAASALLIDRDYLSDTTSTSAARKGIGEWVRKGGHAVVFPQTGGGAAWLKEAFGATFRSIEPIPPGSAVTSTWDGALRGPNIIGRTDWDGWVVARSFTEVVSSRQDAKVILAASQGSLVLIASYPVGSGSVTLVAADLQSQLMNYHPGVYRLMANLVALKPR